MTVDTKTRILDTAEQLFAEHGYAPTSLRQITAAAKVNLAAIHYHFHSKEELLEAVVGRRCKDLNDARIAMLEPLIRKGAAKPGLKEIIEALVLPAFDMTRHGGRGAAMFAKVLGRLYAEPELAARILKKNFGPTSERFMAVLKTIQPAMSKDEVMWRFHFTAGALGQTMLRFPHIQPPPDEHALIAFLAGGFGAPPSTKNAKKKRASR